MNYPNPLTLTKGRRYILGTYPDSLPLDWKTHYYPYTNFAHQNGYEWEHGLLLRYGMSEDLVANTDANEQQIASILYPSFFYRNEYQFNISFTFLSYSLAEKATDLTVCLHPTHGSFLSRSSVESPHPTNWPLLYRADDGNWISFVDDGSFIDLPKVWGPHTIEIWFDQTIPPDILFYKNQSPTFQKVWRNYCLYSIPVAVLDVTHVYDETQAEEDLGLYRMDASGSANADGVDITEYTFSYSGLTTTRDNDEETILYRATEAQEGQQITFGLIIKSRVGISSTFVTKVVTVPVRPKGEQMGAFLHPSGALFTAQNQNCAVQVACQRARILGVENLTSIPDAKNPAMWQRKHGQRTTGTFELVARVVSSKIWKFFRSFNGGKNWDMIGTPFQSTSIDYLDAAPTSSGAIAVAIIKGATTAQNTLVVKRTSDVKNWPPDSEAKTIKTGLPNKPVAICAAPDGSTNFSITGVGLPWLKSKDGVKWE